MATDPVEQVTVETFQGVGAADLLAEAKRLAALPPGSDLPYLSATIDVSPEGGSPNRRPGRQAFDRAVAEHIADMPAHDPARLGLEAALERAVPVLDGFEPSVRGALLVLGGPDGIAEVIPASLPMPNRLVLGPTPALLDLVRFADDEGSYVVVAADQRDAEISVVSAAVADLQITVETNEFPRKQAQGEWSQRRYQMRADERIEAFARTLAQETRRLVESGRVDAVVLAADDPMRSTLRNEFHQIVAEKVVGEVSLLLDVAPRSVIERTRPVVDAAERVREVDAAQAVQDGAGPGGRSVTGAVETLTALQTGQVMTLVMNDDFQSSGWADFTLGSYGVGTPPAEHPAGGEAADLHVVALEQELIRLALLTGAEIEIVRTLAPVDPTESTSKGGAAGNRTKAAEMLDALGGVGAILRYTLASDRST
ncbi:MAG TPA: Vms1/Ankzf1 family peptidyl-tRNA hydrolase, partial [Thermomicrobiales bacterium]|nr:Vms1/Ankzf1 family peptidyl-tRNA hydrolase [Thermomicrobiales bacterium]